MAKTSGDHDLGAPRYTCLPLGVQGWRVTLEQRTFWRNRFAVPQNVHKLLSSKDFWSTTLRPDDSL
jgi:hypothetical protein